MEDALILQELEELAAELSIDLRYEALEGSVGGLCKIRGQTHLLLDRDLSPRQRVAALTHTLAQCELDGVFVRPRLRELLESHQYPPRE